MIKEIIPAITPENITDIQLLKDGLDVFLDYITENSDISIDIKNILNQNKPVIYEEFVKIYLNNIYEVLTKSEHNEALYNKLKTMYKTMGVNIEDIDLSVDIISLLKEEYILTNKAYKESKGTPKAMEYIYNIIIDSGIQEDFLEDNIGGFNYYEGDNLFEYTIEGTMIDEMYEHFVKPLTHPVGWAYTYQRIFYMAFVDKFNINIEYIFEENGFEVVCLNGYVNGGLNTSKDDYANNLAHDGSTLVGDNYVTNIEKVNLGASGNSTEKTTVTFKSGEYLISKDNPRSLILYAENSDELINYNEDHGNCGLTLKYTTNITILTKDEMEFELQENFASTTGKLNVFGAGNVYTGAYRVAFDPKDLYQIDGVDYIDIESKGYMLDGEFKKYTDQKTFIKDVGLDGELITITTPTIVKEDYELVNKNVSVTYKSYTNINVGADVSNVFAAGGITEIDGDNNNLYSDIGGNIVIPNLSGKTARDEFDLEQILEKCPYNADEGLHICTPSFEDLMGDMLYWDSHKLKFDNFNYDGEYVSEEFKIAYDINVWDTDIYFDYFIFDGPYLGGGFKNPA